MGYAVGLWAHIHLLRGSGDKPEQDIGGGISTLGTQNLATLRLEPSYFLAGQLVYSGEGPSGYQ